MPSGRIRARGVAIHQEPNLWHWKFAELECRRDSTASSPLSASCAAAMVHHDGAFTAVRIGIHAADDVGAERSLMKSWEFVARDAFQAIAPTPNGLARREMFE